MDAPGIRLICFLLALITFGALELRYPWAPPGTPTRKWVNLALGALNTAILRIVVPVSLAWVALVTAQHHLGLLNIVALPLWSQVAIALISMDLVIYGQHVAAHHVPFLWRVHRVHHSDAVLDVTSGVRFHPLEMVVSFLVKSAAIVLIGVPITAVVVFEVVLNVSSVFSHANLEIMTKLDRSLRWMFVTPAMHRVHHSSIDQEYNRNFGFNLSIWDRVFGTYQTSSAAGASAIPIGLTEGTPTNPSVTSLLVMPFKRTN